MRTDQAPSGDPLGVLGSAPPGFMDALSYPYFQSVFDRKSRRVALGMTVGSDVIPYESPYEPVPLSELEEALLVMDLQNCPEVFLQPVTADVRRVTGRAEFEQIAQLQAEVWGGNYDWLVTQLEENLAQQPDFWSIYIAYVNNEPACAAWVSFPRGSQFAGLWAGSTLDRFRQMGLYTAVVATRAQEAIQRGYRFLMVDASDMSRPILQKRGFEFMTHTTPYTWKNPDFEK